MIAKQESVDYYYSNCNNPVPPPTPIAASSMNFMDHGTDGNTFPSFYSLISANSAGRRADEMLSAQGYRSVVLTKLAILIQSMSVLNRSIDSNAIVYRSLRLPMDCLFNETLDLSQDDIQRTLSANLSHETAFHCNGGVVGGGSDGGVGRSIRTVEAAAEDDLLVNLDAFDMLTEFSDLDCHDTIDSLVSIQADGAGSGSPPVHDGSDGKDPNGIRRIHQLKDMPSPTLSAAGDSILTAITDFSPEWAPTEVYFHFVLF